MHVMYRKGGEPRMEEENVARLQRTELSIAWLSALFMTVRGETSETASETGAPSVA